MIEHQTSEGWIPLMEYAIKKGISLSTLRRYIKANKIQYKVENGRYLLFDGETDKGATLITAEQSLAQATPKLIKLEKDLMRAQEEIAELKMLIALYEEKMSPQRLDS